MRPVLSLLLPLMIGIAACSPGQAALTPDTLPRALTEAKPGSTLELSPGFYGELVLNRREGLTIKGGRDVVFSGVRMVQAKRIRLDGFTIRMEPNAQTTATSQAIRIVEADKVTLSGLLIEGGPAVNGIARTALVGTPNPTGTVLGLPAGRAMNITRSSDITVEKCEIRQFHKGVTFGHVRGFTVTDNDIHDLRTSPISGGGVSNVLIARNHGWRSTPWQLGGKGDHGDFIHIWTAAKGQEGPSTDIKILDNLWEQRDGAAMLGIYLDDDRNALGFTNVEVARNVLIVSEGQGLRLERVSGVVRDNVLLWNGGDGDHRKHPQIVLGNGNSNLQITGNRARAVGFRKGTELPGVVERGNRLGTTRGGEAEAAVKAWLAKFRPGRS